MSRLGNGNTSQRGYGADHQTTRKQWAPRVNTGTVKCWRCHHLIIPDPTKFGDGWQIGHDDLDRTITRGPEHMECNTATAGRRGAYITNAKRSVIIRDW